MSNRRLSIMLALFAVSVAMLARLALVERSGFAAEDLARFEASAEGLDLPDWYADVPFFLTWSRGDGQTFVTLGIDPAATGPSRFLGNGLYRYGRIGYPLLARLVVGWNSDLLPVGLWLVNTAAVAGLGWLAGSGYSSLGRRSLLLPVNPAVFIGYAQDTAEPLALFALVMGAMAGGRFVVILSGLLLGTSREAYVTAAPLAKRPLVFSAVGLLGFAVARLVGLSRGLEWSATAGSVVLPGVGYWTAWADQSALGRSVGVAVLSVALLTLWSGLTERRGATRAAFVVTALLVLGLSDLVVEAPANLVRAAAVLPVLWILQPTPTAPRS